MTRKSWLLLITFLALGVGFVYRFTDWILAPKIQIDVLTRPSGRPGRDPELLPTLFMLDREYPIRVLRVIAVSNVPPPLMGKPVWQVIATGKPELLRGFEYGDAFAGTKAIQAPQKLAPDGVYRIEIESGRFKGQREFRVQAPGAPSAEQ